MVDFGGDEMLSAIEDRRRQRRAPDPTHHQFWTDGNQRRPLQAWLDNPTVANVMQMDANDAAGYLFYSAAHTRAIMGKLQGKFDKIVVEFKERTYWLADGSTTDDWHKDELAEEQHKKEGKIGGELKEVVNKLIPDSIAKQEDENGNGKVFVEFGNEEACKKTDGRSTSEASAKPKGSGHGHVSCPIEVVLRTSGCDKPVLFRDGFYRAASRVLYIKPCVFGHCEEDNINRLSWLAGARIWPTTPKGMPILLKSNSDQDKNDNVIVSMLGVIGLWMEQGIEGIFSTVGQVKILGCGSTEHILAKCGWARDVYVVHPDNRMHVALNARHAFRQLCRANCVQVRRSVPLKVVAADELSYDQFWQRSTVYVANQLGHGEPFELHGVGDHGHEVDIDDSDTYPPQN